MPINADQCWSKLQHWSQCRSIPIIADHANRHWSELISSDLQWSALRGISDQCQDFDLYWSALIYIDRGSPVLFIDHIFINPVHSGSTFTNNSTCEGKTGSQFASFYRMHCMFITIEHSNIMSQVSLCQLFCKMCH